MLGTNGDRGVSHPKVDARAGVPDGTTSFYFRSRKALLQGVATRLNELDVADMSLLSEVTGLDTAEFSGIGGFARIVMYTATEPWLTRAKARYELLLQASRDPELAAILTESANRFYALARTVVTQWHPPDDQPSPAVIADQAAVLLTFVNGVMMTIMLGIPLVDSAGKLEALMRGVLAGIKEA